MSVEFQRSTYYDRVNKIIDSLVLKNSPSDNEIIKLDQKTLSAL